MSTQLGQKSAVRALTEGKATLMLVIAAAMWSFSGTWIKLVDFHPMVTNALRCVFAAITLYIFFTVKKEKLSFRKEALLGGAITTGVMCFTACALSMTTTANAIILQYTSPVFVLLISVFFFKQKLRVKDVVVVLLSIFGVALFFFDSIAVGNMLGNVFALVGGIFFALSFIYNNRTKENPLHIIFWSCVFSTIIGIPFLFFYPPTITVLGTVATLMMGIVHLGIPYIIYCLAIKHCSALNASIATMVEPILNPFWVFLIVGEMPGKYALYGGVLVLGVISFYSISNAKAKQKESMAAAE